ncbi:type IV pilus assembly protein PilW [Pseudomonas citronellolis]|uniref:Type IV pilus assembly protein PilW n=1 Tax=Pseudomonas citronellolis TaxID=53408 RepID=A0AAQ1R0H9_9PSED|nr:prepilin-type N-terminal cleavage/methylation domain-containing protein [Pseudomonas citronellolis]SFD81372.1 type IV pilus assembly protein PilW [Pseudomonas citronellolis]
MRGSHLRHGQRGLSLVELMVALLLGSVLIIGVTQLFLDQKRHAQFQFGQLANQGNARFATHAIERLVGRAGYRAKPQAQIAEEAFPARVAVHGCPAFAAGQTLALTQGGKSAALCVRYQRGLEAQEADCGGTSLPFSTQPLTVVARLALDSNAGTLTCAAFVEGGSGPGSAACWSRSWWISASSRFPIAPSKCSSSACTCCSPARAARAMASPAECATTGRR